MKKLKKFGQWMVVFNIFYCLVNAAIEALHERQYLFTSEYFFAAAGLMVLLLNLEIYFIVREQKQGAVSR